MSKMQFNDLVAVVTGAGGGLGRAHAMLLASRGAKVVVNDLGGGFNGDGTPKKSMADEVVKEILATGGTAVADYNSVADGDKIIETAVKTYGAVHILVNNAGILRDKSFRNMTDKDWDLVQEVHMFGTFKTTRAAWPIMKKQRFGRIVNTASGAGTYGNFGQTNYCAAKAGIMGFTFAIAEEGAEYNITANVLAPIAASRLTQTVMAKDLLDKLNPDYVAPVVPALSQKTQKESGSLFELGGGCISKFRWQRSQGVRFASDPTATDIESRWNEVADFTNAVYTRPNASTSSATFNTSSMPSPARTSNLKDKVALVYGAASDLGQQTAVALAASGVSIILSDATTSDMRNVQTAISRAGGTSVVVIGDAQEIGTKALQHSGRVDVIVFCGPEFSPAPLDRVSDAEWRRNFDGHSRAAYKLIQPIWTSMVKNKYGRILLGSSEHGLYGVKDGAPYSASTHGVVGFMRALFREGQKYNIRVNALASGPTLSQRQLSISRSLALLLCSDSLDPKTTGKIYCASGDNLCSVRWERSYGHAFATDATFTPELVAEKWQQVITFDQKADHPDSAADGMKRMLEHTGQGGTFAVKQAPKK